MSPALAACLAKSMEACTLATAVMVRLLELQVEDARSLATLDDATWRDVLTMATTAAGLNCLREGASPPTRAEVAAYLDPS